MRRRIGGLCGALLVCGVLGGCGGSKTVTVTRSASSSASSTTAAASGTGTATTGTATTASSTTVGSASTAPLASQRGAWGGEPVRLDGLSLSRSGSVAQVSVRLTNLGKPSTSQDTVQVADLFSGAAGANSSKLFDTLGGLVLIDPTDNREYPVARDSGGNCVCDGGLDNTFIDPGQSTVLSALFGAPPQGVGSVDLFVPHFGTLHDLPISTG